MLKKFYNAINEELKAKGAKTACWFVREADMEEDGFEVKLDVTVKKELLDSFEIEGFDVMPYESNLVTLFSFTEGFPEKYGMTSTELYTMFSSLPEDDCGCVFTSSVEFYPGALEKHRAVIQGGRD